MKTLMLSLLLITQTWALSAQANELPLEVSAALLSESCSTILADQNKLAINSGHKIKITNYNVQNAEKLTVTLTLEKRASADLNGAWMPLGEVISVLSFDPMGNLTVEESYFVPAAEPPGGSSVGTKQ